MNRTPPKRTLRSNSNPNSDSLDAFEMLKVELIHSFKSEISKISSQLSILSSRMDNFEESLKSIVQSQTVTKQKISTLDDKIKTLSLELSEIKKEQCTEDVIKEFEMRFAKKNNVIVHGIPEMVTGTVEDRKEHDLRKVTAILEELKIEKFHIKKIYRIGRNLQKQRLMCVTLEDISTKQEILRKANLLRNSNEFKRCFVNPDFTFSQRKSNQELRRLQKEKRAEGEDVVIKNGRLIRREDSKHANFH